MAYLVREADRNLPPVTDGLPVTQPTTAGPAAPTRHELSFGSGQIVYWMGEGLEDEARKLGEALRETKYFNGKTEKGVELARAGDTRVIKFYMPSVEVSKPRVQTMVRDYGGILWAAIAFESKPVIMKLCDETMVERASYQIEPSSRYQFGPRSYVYHTTVLRTEAVRFGQFAAKAGDAERPSNWTLTKHGETWVVCPGAMGDVVTEEAREGFRQAARQISDEVFGGQSVELRVFTKDGVEAVSADRKP